MISKMRAEARVSTTEGASAAAPGSSKGGESAEMSGATKAFATELKKINNAYYNELFKLERDD